MRYLLPALLLLTTACQSSTDHAKAVAAKALPHYAADLRPASLRAYPVSAAKLGQYLRGEPGRAGHLVTYICQRATHWPQVATFAAFVDEADSGREFVPDKNSGLFAANYGVDYRMQ